MHEQDGLRYELEVKQNYINSLLETISTQNLIIERLRAELKQHQEGGDAQG